MLPPGNDYRSHVHRAPLLAHSERENGDAITGAAIASFSLTVGPRKDRPRGWGQTIDRLS
jgi:hypothetical protein